MVTNETKTFIEVKCFFRPLDLIFFRGTDVVSDFIRVMERETTGNGDFSHCGILINKEIMPTVPELESNRWYVWESTFTAVGGFMSKFSDGTANISGKGKFGVQIRDLESVITTYTGVGGEVAWAPLLQNPWIDASDSERKKLSKKMGGLHKIIGNRIYDSNCLTLCAVVFPFLRKPRDIFNKWTMPQGLLLTSWDPSEELEGNVNPNEIPAVQPGNDGITGWLFCSELVALVYQRIGLVDKKFDPQDVMPVDFLGVDVDGMPRLVRDPIYLKPKHL